MTNPHIQRSLVVGLAQVTITPPLGTLINGGFFPQTATAVHDELFAKALYLQQDDVALVIIVVDTCVLSSDYARQVRLQIAAATTIAFENISLSATHTHAAGSVSEVFLCGVDAAYSEWLPTQLVAVVQQAIRKAQPARVDFGSVLVPEHVLCRRYIMKGRYNAFNPVTQEQEPVVTNPFGAAEYIEHSASDIDPEVGYIALQNREGQWLGILANYSLQYVGDAAPGAISADYFGEFARQLQNKLSTAEGFVAIMSNGTSGDVNCHDLLHPERYPTTPFQKSQFIAADLATRLVMSLDWIEWEAAPTLGVVYRELELPVRKPSGAAVAAAKAVTATVDYSQLTDNEDALVRIYAREQLLLNDYPDTMAYPLQAFRIGEGIIGSIGGELFAETGLWLKANSPAGKYFTIGLANGNAGYIPPANDLACGGYETWLCRQSYSLPETEQLIREHFLEMLEKLAG